MEQSALPFERRTRTANPATFGLSIGSTTTFKAPGHSFTFTIPPMGTPYAGRVTDGRRLPSSLASLPLAGP